MRANPKFYTRLSIIFTVHTCPTGMSIIIIVGKMIIIKSLEAGINSCINIGLGYNLNTHYYTKTSVEGTYSWQSGTYCIAKYSGRCPASFFYGYTHWDNEEYQ